MIRTADHPVHPLFIDRWSPRSFDSSALSQADLHTIFEAARWAPSSSNIQPWRFLYAHRGDAAWSRFVSLLVPANQIWATSASVLVMILSDRFYASRSGDLKESQSHSFDAGAAWMAMALQARLLGYDSHAMLGVDFDRARAELRVPERFKFNAAVAIGRRAEAANLPDSLRERETPSGRNPVSSFAFGGGFPNAPA